MKFFSDDYLMHWGVKGMKWKKKHGLEDDRPGDHVAPEASDDYEGPVEELRKKRQRELAIQRIRERRGRMSEAKAARARARFEARRRNDRLAEQGNAMRRARTSSGAYATDESKRGLDDRNYTNTRMWRKESGHLKRR